jgi:hypothetical protein
LLYFFSLHLERSIRWYFWWFGEINRRFFSVPILVRTIFSSLLFVFTIINFFAELSAKLFEWLIPLLTILYYIGLILLVLWSVLLTVRALWERYEWSAVITAVLMVIVAYLWENQFSVFINRRSPAYP